MGFDWKRLEREDRERQHNLALHLGLSWTVLGVAFILVTILTGRPERALVTGLIWLVLGLVPLGAALHARRARTRGDAAARDSLPHDDT